MKVKFYTDMVYFNTINMRNVCKYKQVNNWESDSLACICNAI